MKFKGKKFEPAETTETQQRSREIQLLLYVIQPDPDLQAFFVSDFATAFDVTGDKADEVERRLKNYFGDGIILDLSLPLWKLADSIKRQHPQWPDEWPPEVH